jgi:hypothetical protein
MRFGNVLLAMVADCTYLYHLYLKRARTMKGGGIVNLHPTFGLHTIDSTNPKKYYQSISGHQFRTAGATRLHTFKLKVSKNRTFIYLTKLFKQRNCFICLINWS